jgi:hypothetical protein
VGRGGRGAPHAVDSSLPDASRAPSRRPVGRANYDTRTDHAPVPRLRTSCRPSMRTVTRQSRFQIQTVSILLSVSARIRFLASLMSARRVAVTSSKETDMGKWTQFTKQHEGYDKREDKKKDKKHRHGKRR